MHVIFDTKKIQSLIDHFYNLTNLPVSFCDSDFSPIVFTNTKSKFCALIEHEHEAKCLYCNMHALMKVQQKKEIYSYTCHSGLMESVLPVFYDDIIVAYIFVGQYRDSAGHFSALERMQQSTKDYGIDPEELLEAYIHLPVLSDKQIASVFEIFKSFITLMWKEGMIKNADQSLYAQISHFVDTNLQDPLQIETLCRHLCISKNLLYKLVSENSGMTVNNWILTKKIVRAKQLLLKTDFSISRVAEESGFSDQNYFIRVFKKSEGITPLQFRKRLSIEDKTAQSDSSFSV